MPPGATSNFQLNSGALYRAPGGMNRRDRACSGVSAMLVGGPNLLQPEVDISQQRVGVKAGLDGLVLGDALRRAPASKKGLSDGVAPSSPKRRITPVREASSVPGRRTGRLADQGPNGPSAMVLQLAAPAHIADEDVELQIRSERDHYYRDSRAPADPRPAERILTRS
jgi:hypothetical protein